jgi:uncharacterized membrane protein (DUF2068 family)
MMLPVIGVFKLLKALLIIAVALGALHAARGDDPADMLERWTRELHIDPDGRHVGRVVQRILALDERHLRALSAGMFVYAGVFIVEGVGLIARRRWAEWFTVLVTGSFVPLEIYEIARHPGAVRIGALVVNLAIVAYLVVRLRRRREA